MEKIRVYSKARGIRVLKEGFTLAQFAQYKETYPDAIQIREFPSICTLEKWVSNASAEAVDGCSGIEPDGHCEHGYPSWLLALGYI